MVPAQQRVGNPETPYLFGPSVHGRGEQRFGKGIRLRRLGVTQNPGQKPGHGVHDHQGGRLAARQDVIADRYLFRFEERDCPLVVLESRPFQDRLLIRFDGFETREEAEAIHGAELTIGRDQVAPLPEGRYYRFELEGLRVATKQGAHLGVVTAVFGTGANDVVAVKGASGEILIPLLPEVIVSVDVAGCAMVVDPPPGLPGMPEGA